MADTHTLTCTLILPVDVAGVNNNMQQCNSLSWLRTTQASVCIDITQARYFWIFPKLSELCQAGT